MGFNYCKAVISKWSSEEYIYRADDNEKYEYKGRDLGSCTFEVILPQTGEYKLLFTCDDFAGEYGVTYSNQEK